MHVDQQLTFEAVPSGPVGAPLRLGDWDVAFWETTGNVESYAGRWL
jgi:hypothetical protein